MLGLHDIRPVSNSNFLGNNGGGVGEGSPTALQLFCLEPNIMSTPWSTFLRRWEVPRKLILIRSSMLMFLGIRLTTRKIISHAAY